MTLQGRDSMDKEIWWELRCGHSSTWFDNWTQLGALHYVLPISHEHVGVTEEVNQLMVHGRWNENLMSDIFTEEVCDQVQSVLDDFQVSEDRDKPWWMPDSKGRFTVESAWTLSNKGKTSRRIS